MAKPKEETDIWEVKGNCMAPTCSSAKYCGYSLQTLKDMAKTGIHLYKNGKRVKLCDVK